MASGNSRISASIQRNFIKGGYLAWSRVFMIIFNVSVAGFLLIIGSPVFLIVGLMVWVFLGSPVIYKGTLLGLHKQEFTMYKFRTLPIDARKSIGSDLLSYKHNMLNPFTKFMRDTRLDELPQLVNIIKGDMNFVGPRPIRPEVYEKVAHSIPDFDIRFEVKPGMIGISQLFTPHSSPKRIRSLIDNHLVNKTQNIFWVLGLVVYTIGVVIKETIVKGWFTLMKVYRTTILRKYREMRRLDRVIPDRTTVRLKNIDGRKECAGPYHLLDINEEYFKIIGDFPLEEGIQLFCFERKFSKRGKTKRKRAILKGQFVRKIKNDRNQYEFVVKYDPVNDLNHYRIETYFLNKSLG